MEATRQAPRRGPGSVRMKGSRLFPPENQAEPPLDQINPPIPLKPRAARTENVEMSSGSAKPAKADRLTDASAEGVDLSSPDLYLNREFTWIDFNGRVLAMAKDARPPLLERLKFLAIVGSNFDEFFMKRVGVIGQQVRAGVRDRSFDGRTPIEQVAESASRYRQLLPVQESVRREIVAGLRDHDVHVLAYDELDETERESIRAYYLANIYPLVTPQAMDPAHPFPFVSNLSLNLLVTLHHPKDSIPVRARVKVPLGPGIPRFLRVSEDDRFVPLEEVMAANLDLLFPGMEIESCDLFRITRNVAIEREEEGAEDLLALIESELIERRFADIVRLEVDTSMPDAHRKLLSDEFGLDLEHGVFEVEGMLGLRDLMQVAGLERPELHDPPHRPLDHPELISDRPIFDIIRDRTHVFVAHPYQSFTSSVERFLKEASTDPQVLAIKMTVYRTSEDSHVIDHLIEAARRGKQVAVVVELKARFDEEANIRWANRLEQFGIHVTYGVMGVKTHCKVILAVRRDRDGLRRYVHLGTGNYHAQNARIYSDVGLLTCDPEIGADVTELFNYLTTGYKPKRRYAKLLVAPSYMKPGLLEMIDREIEIQRGGGEGLIQLKVNALEHPEIAQALYRASSAGVKVDLIVRDTCRVRPGLPGISETMRIVSLVGRFLEHARIFYFRGGGEERYYIGSADVMGRNLDARVEELVPIEDEDGRAYLRFMLDAQLEDDRNAWDMLSDGTYRRRMPVDRDAPKDSHKAQVERAERDHKGATRLRRRKPSGLSKRVHD